MNVALKRTWTANEFLDWAVQQDQRYEFDGIRPVLMNGGSLRHDNITGSLRTALRARLRGSRCSNYGPNVGIRTIGEIIRYPDGLVTCTSSPDTDRIASGPVIVFEVVSPSSRRYDHFIKFAEYKEVPSILRYVVIESDFPGLHVYHRQPGEDTFGAFTLKADAIMSLPEVSIDVPVAELYEDVVFPDSEESEASDSD